MSIYFDKGFGLAFDFPFNYIDCSINLLQNQMWMRLFCLDAGFQSFGRSFSSRLNEQSQIDLVPFSNVLCHVFFRAKGSRLLIDRKNVPRTDTHRGRMLRTRAFMQSRGVAVLAVFKAAEWALHVEDQKKSRTGTGLVPVIRCRITPPRRSSGGRGSGGCPFAAGHSASRWGKEPPVWTIPARQGVFCLQALSARFCCIMH